MATTIDFYIRKDKKRSDGTYLVQALLVHNRTNATINLNIYTALVRSVRGSSSMRITDPYTQAAVDAQIQQLRSIITNNIEAVSRFSTAKEVKDFILSVRDRSKEIDFLDFAATYAKGIEVDTTRRYTETRVDAIRQYIFQRTKSETLPVNNITSSFISDYEAWLSTKKAYGRHAPLSQNTIASYMTCFKRLFKACRLHYNDYDNGIIVIKHDPFMTYKSKPLVATKKRAVELEVIRKIYDYSSPFEARQMTRDLMIMSFCLAGMNLVDFYQCNPIVDNVITYTRSKTGRHKKEAPTLSLVIPDIIKPLVEKYRDPEGERAFWFYSRWRDMVAFNQMIRRGILYLREVTGVPDLTYYAMRHTFATIARNELGYSMEDVAICLTHETGYKVTDTYIRKDYKLVNKIIADVVNYAFNS